MDQLATFAASLREEVLSVSWSWRSFKVRQFRHTQVTGSPTRYSWPLAKRICSRSPRRTARSFPQRVQRHSCSMGSLLPYSRYRVTGRESLAGLYRERMRPVRSVYWRRKFGVLRRDQEDDEKIRAKRKSGSGWNWYSVWRSTFTDLKSRHFAGLAECLMSMV